MQLRLILAFLPALAATSAAIADDGTAPLTLGQCREMAMTNNKQLRIQAERVKAAGYSRKEARAAYLPGFDFAGGYIYNQKNISIFDKDQYLPTMSFDPQTGSYTPNLVTDPSTSAPVMADGHVVPSTVALIPKEAMEFNIHNVFFGAVTLTQPVYMGGKIVALNKMASLNEDMQRALLDNTADDVTYAVDAAYWMVVSLKAKQRLAKDYLNLLDSLQRNVRLMVDEGVATRADLLSVDVKRNEAEVDMTKVDNGLALSRMSLAQVCGLPADSPMILADEDSEDPAGNDADGYPLTTGIDMTDVYSRRADLHALEIGKKITGQQAKVELASMLPNIAVIGSYEFSNPNLQDGFKRRVAGSFSVGAMVRIPLWHWGGDYNKYRAAKTQETILGLTVEDTKEKIRLQVNQAAYKTREAVKTYEMTRTNLAKASENLRCATLGFSEGVLTVTNVMEAQTAWLKANSENIDAGIDLRLCRVYLAKVLGTLN